MGDFIGTVTNVLQSGPSRWDDFLGCLPRAILEKPPLPGEWSAINCLQHLIDVEVVFESRAGLLAAGKDLPAFDPDTDGQVGRPVTDVAALLDAFRESRTRSLTTIAMIREEDLDRTAIHEELGPVSLRELLNEWAAHDLLHMVQAERAAMQPFIAGTGKWRMYFSDHDVSLVEA